LEFGPGSNLDHTPDKEFNLVVRDFNDLATKLGV
jgi:hypothetical protein